MVDKTSFAAYCSLFTGCCGDRHDGDRPSLTATAGECAVFADDNCLVYDSAGG